MILISWNCQGLGSDLTVRHLADIHRKYQPEFLFLMETKNKTEKIEKLQRRLRMESSIVVDPIGISGGLTLLYNKVGVEMISKSRNIIDIRFFSDEANGSLRITWVYGECDFWERQKIWDRLRMISGDVTEPWYVLGTSMTLLAIMKNLGEELRTKDVLEPLAS